MYNYKAIHYNKYGYIVKYNRCSRLEIGFGSFLLSQSINEFTEFRKAIYESFLSMNLPGSIMPKQKIIQIATPLRNLYWVLSPIELKALASLLEQARIALEADRILHPSEYEN